MLIRAQPGGLPMNRFFLPENAAVEKGAEVTIEGADAHHIARVLRLGRGERIVVVAAPGREGLAELVDIGAGCVRARVLAVRSARRESPVFVRLVQSVAKGEKMDYIVQKSTELGVGEILPVVSERSVVRLDRERGGERAQRWQKIAREAAQQSGRTVVPRILPPVPFAAALPARLAAGDLALMPYEGEFGRGLQDVLAAASVTAGGTVTIYIGPEGGFTDREVAAAAAAGCIPVSLGPRILRAETAGPAALTMILYHLGDLGRAVQPVDPWEE